MSQFRYNKALIAVIVVGLLAALAIDWQRHLVEEKNKQVELAMDFEDVAEWAQMEGLPLKDLLREIKAAGIISLAVYETTLEKLHRSGKVSVWPGADLMGRYQPFFSLREQIVPEHVYVAGQGPVFEETKTDLIRRLGAERVREISVSAGTSRVLEIKGKYEKLMKVDLGLPSDELRTVAEHGFYVIARPTNYAKVKADDVNAVFERVKTVDNVSAMVFVAQQALGYPDQLALTARQMRQNNMTLGLIEHPSQLQFYPQAGLSQLASATGYKAARLYAIPKDEQPKLTLTEAVHRWTLSDRERNIRINLLRKYEKPLPGKTLTETNLQYISAVKSSLLGFGFTIDRAGVYQPYFPASWLLVAVIAGAVAAGVLFLTLVYPFKVQYQYGLLAVVTVILAVPALKGGGTLVRQVTALASAIIFPVLAMTWQLDCWRRYKPAGGSAFSRIVFDGAAGLTVTVLLSLAGGLYLAAVLADIRFLLEMEIFRGVKLTFVAPLVLIFIVYLTRFSLFDHCAAGPRSIWRQVEKLLDYPVAVKTLLIFGLLIFGAWVFIGRSGHTAGVPVPVWEIKLRQFLERVMYARPREKEFLIGHPAFMLAVMALYQNWPRMLHLALVIAATIGQVTLVETFAHMRTPVYMSLMRGLDGLLLGLIAGLLAVVAVQILRYLSYVLGRGTAANE